MRNFSGINLSYTYWHYLALVIRIYFVKNLIYPKAQAARRILVK